MRPLSVAAVLMFSHLASASTNNIDLFVERYNKIFSDEIPVCHSVKAETPEASGYHIAMVTLLTGEKELRRVPQNTLKQFQKVDQELVANFHSYRWDGKSQQSKTEISYLKIETTPEGLPRLNMYTKNFEFQAGHAIASFEDGSVEFVMAESAAIQKHDGLENANKDAMFYLYVIRAKRENNEISYAVNDLIYHFPKELRERIEKETGKKFFKDKKDENGRAFMGNVYTYEEIQDLAEKYGVSAIEDANQPWKNCPLPAKDELSKSIVKSNRLPSSTSKNKFSFKHLWLGLFK